MSSTGILLVEDDDAIREVTAEFLRDSGYTVYEAPNGRPALERLRTHPEGLVVLLDLMMPGMDGYAVLHALAEEASLSTRHAYILFSTMSTYHARQVAERFKFLNVTSLRKPFDLDDLLAAVQKAASSLQ